MNKKRKIIASALIATTMLSSIGFAAQQSKLRKLNGVTGGMTYKLDGKDVTKQIEKTYGTPGVVLSGDEFGEGRSYFPARAMELMEGIEVKYDHPSRTVSVTNNSEERFNKILKSKDDEIEKLKKEKKQLQDKLDKGNVTEVEKQELRDLEKEINRRYGDYERILFTTSLSEKKDIISVEIATDLSYYENKAFWDRLTRLQREDLVKGVVGMVEKEYKNNEIKGEIVDSDRNRGLLSFKKEKGKKLTIGTGGGTAAVGDLEAIAEDSILYYFENERIRDVWLTRFDLRDNTRIPRITMTVEVYEAKKVSDRTYERVFNEVVRELEYEYGEGCDIRIDVYEDRGRDLIGGYDKPHDKYTGTYKSSSK